MTPYEVITAIPPLLKRYIYNNSNDLILFKIFVSFLYSITETFQPSPQINEVHCGAIILY